MKLIVGPASAFLLSLAIAMPGFSQDPAGHASVPGEFIVTLSIQIRVDAIDLFLGELGASILDRHQPADHPPIVLVRVPPERERAFVEAVRQPPIALIRSVDRNWYRYAETPRVRSADREPCSPSRDRDDVAGAVTVAVIDSGIGCHKDLQSRLWVNPGESDGIKGDGDGNGIADDRHGANWVTRPPSADPIDDFGHGTAVSGLVAGLGDDCDAITDSSTTRIMSLKFLDRKGRGTDWAAIRAIDYAIDKRARVINASWGSRSESTALGDAITRAQDAGILFIAAAGNTAHDHYRDNDTVPHFPSNYEHDNVIAVLAVDCYGDIEPRSHYGEVSVDLGAPGWDVWTTFPDDEWDQASGTSMAAAVVSGAAARIWAADPQLSYREVRTRLERVRKVRQLRAMCVTEGVLDLSMALQP